MTTGQRAGTTVTVPPGGVLSLGRSSESDLQLLDLGVSRFHCVLECQADNLVVTDLSSSNGTFVNGQRVKRQPLEVGDSVELGPVTLVVDRVPQPKRSVADRLFTDRGHSDVRVVRRAARGEPLDLRSQAEAGLGGRRLEEALAAVYRINEAINRQGHIGALLGEVMDTVLEVVPAERGFLLLADERSGELHPRVGRVAPNAQAPAELPISRPVVDQAMADGAGVLCPDLKADERFRDGDRLAMDHIRSVLCVPLDPGGQVLGAIYLDTASEREPLGESDLELLTAVARQASLALHRAQLVEELERLFLGAIETLVATVEAKDIYTYGHSARVSKLALGIAQRMGLPEETQEAIKLAGLLHDVGKIGIPEAILTKPDRLSDEEWGYIRSHPQIGEGIIRQMGSRRLAEIQRIVRHHHERLDGGGYPDGIAGEAIPLGARVLAVADAYDAMTSNRPYRTPFTAEAALAELRRGAGQQFDPRAVEALEKIRGEGRPAEAQLAGAAQEQ
ncbi:MAG: HD domain-containing phosphohydrolase [Candidatus Brocadiia bacterium]